MSSTAMIICWILLAEPPDGATGVDRNHRRHNLVDHHGHGAAGKHRPHGCQLVPDFYMRGFQTASLAVVGIMIAGAIIVAFHQVYDPDKDPSREQASPAVTDDSAGDFRSTRISPSETTGAFHLGQIMDSRPYPDRFNGAKTPVSGT